MKRELILVLLLLTVIPMASAEIFITQPESVYSLGDSMQIQATIRPNAPTNDFMLMQLICTNITFDIYRNYFNLNPQEERQVDIDFLVDNSLGLGDEEECYVLASYGEDSVESIMFDVTRKISIGLNLAKKIWEPGEKMDITGTAIKMNGQGANGFVDILIEPAGLSASAIVSNGSFNLSLILPDDYSGEQIVNSRVYEKNVRNEVTNEGDSESIIEIRAKLSQIRINLNSNSINPGDSVDYTIELVDQGGNVMSGDVAVTIFKPNGLAFLEEIKSSGTQSTIQTFSNSSAGYWKIEAALGNTTETKLFYVEEKRELTFSLLNETLLVTNVGNVIFEGPIEIFIGSENEIIQVKLGVGENKKYKLSAPEGDYQVVAKEGDKEVNFGAISLTGRVVDIGEVGEGISGAVKNNWIAWIFIVAILGVLALMFFYRKGLSDALQAKFTRTPKNEDGIVSNGARFEAGVVLLNTAENLDSYSLAAVEQAVEKAKEYGAGVNYDGAHRIMLFTPLLTKKKDNIETALKAANEMENVLKDYNRKHSHQVKYGIGVNFGHIIAENKAGKMRFVSVGNVISLAKRMSAQAKEEILVSDAFHRRTLNIGKFEKKDDYWKVSSVADRGQHEKFIKGFLDKQKKD